MKRVRYWKKKEWRRWSQISLLHHGVCVHELKGQLWLLYTSGLWCVVQFSNIYIRLREAWSPTIESEKMNSLFLFNVGCVWNERGSVNPYRHVTTTKRRFTLLSVGHMHFSFSSHFILLSQINTKNTHNTTHFNIIKI